MLKFLLAFGLTFSLMGAEFHPNRLLVKVKDGFNFNQYNVSKVKELIPRLFVVYTDNVVALENELKDHDFVEYVQKDFINKKRELAKVVPTPKSLETMNAAFNDPRIGSQWTFKDARQNGISVNDAYISRSTNPREDVIVAVVDTGVDYNHEDLKDVMWVNEAEKNGVAGVDDDGNGYVDDVYGIDTLERDSNGEATGDPMDTHSHGTHVSGTIAAKQNNGKGVAGIASRAKIMAIRTVPNRGDETDVDVVESFVYAAKNGAKIINCSFGKAVNEGGMAVSDAIKFIGEKYGVLVIAAAGNSSQNIDRRLTYPASFENEHLMVVASTTSRGSLSYFSNYGLKNVDVAAPGSSILSTTPRNRYSSMSGTSMASPTVAGVAAELLANSPELGPLELKQQVMSTVTPVGSFKGKMVTGGRVDLKEGLQSL